MCFVTKYVVVQVECSYQNIYGVYETRADAEEAIFCEAETWAYEVIMTDDPMDFMDEEEWNYPEHWRYLMKDAGRAFEVQEVLCFN